MCSETLNDMMVCTQTITECSTQTSTTGFSKQLSLLAKDDISGSKIAVQCVAVSRTYNPDETCIPFIEYSRFAFLNGKVNPTNVSPFIRMCVCVGHDTYYAKVYG